MLRLIRIALLTLIFCGSVISGDWTQWRGENRDGIIASSEIPAQWPDVLKKIWEIEIGEGHSTPLLLGKHVITFARKNEFETISKIDAGNGKVLWEKQYAAPYEMNQYARGHGKGPKSSPVASDDYVITMGITGIVTCINIKSGEQVWQHKEDKKQDLISPIFGTSMSPLIFENMTLAHVGGEKDGAFTAFDLKTGKEIWKWSGDGPAYASPIVYEKNNTKQIVTFSREFIIGLDLKSGALLWQIPFETAYGGMNSVTPIVYENDLILSGYDSGIMRISVDKTGDKWTTKEVWKNNEVSCYMSSPVLFDDVIVIFTDKNKGMLATINPQSGEILWQGEKRTGENAAIVRSGNLMIALINDAKLVIAEKDGSGFNILKQYETAESQTWAHPVFFDKRVLIKDKEHLTLWALEE